MSYSFGVATEAGRFSPCVSKAVVGCQAQRLKLSEMWDVCFLGGWQGFIQSLDSTVLSFCF